MTTGTVGGPTLEISRPDKVLLPDDEVIKADVVDYYQRVTEAMLPHVRGRAVAMQRFPDGIGSDGFLHKQAPAHFSDFVRRAHLVKQDGHTDYVAIDNAATIVYLAEQTCITRTCGSAGATLPTAPTG